MLLKGESFYNGYKAVISQGTAVVFCINLAVALINHTVII